MAPVIVPFAAAVVKLKGFTLFTGLTARGLIKRLNVLCLLQKRNPKKRSAHMMIGPAGYMDIVELKNVRLANKK